MFDCKYKVNSKCQNPKGCIYYNQYVDEACLYCTSGEEKSTNELSSDYNLYGEEQKTEKIVIANIGKDAEITVNTRGGKQSKSPMAAYLLDPKFLQHLTEYGSTIHYIANFMEESSLYSLEQAVRSIEKNPIQIFIRISKVLQEGQERYAPNNWRLIPQEEHINHALIHLFAAELGDTQDNHIDHALCRLMMAYATEPSEGFRYTEYIKK